ncbi:MAG: hypothetical protein M3328_12130, partial [Chloroflexota bacterium]|nr:hypothetical protein [Chloroflexota bacterium]
LKRRTIWEEPSPRKLAPLEAATEEGEDGQSAERKAALAEYNKGLERELEGDWTAASVHYGMALRACPDFAPAIMALARTAKAAIPGPAPAEYALGRQLEKRGDWVDASTHYAKALTAVADYAPALEGLARTGPAAEPLIRRYFALLGTACRMVALELTRYRLLKKKGYSGSSASSRNYVATTGGLARLRDSLVRRRRKALEDKKQGALWADYKGVVHNYIGLLYSSAGQRLKPCRVLYDLANEDFEEASKRCPDWYQPHENKADNYTFMARDWQQAREENKAIGCLFQALIEYDKALDLLDKFSAGQDIPGIRRRINIGKATALIILHELLPQRGTFLADARKAISEAEGVSPPDGSQAVEPWEAAREKNDRVLYNIACWYGLAHKLKDKDKNKDTDKDQEEEKDKDKDKARRYLVYSLIRTVDPHRWDWALEDPDLESIRDPAPQHWERLKFEVKSAMQKTQSLPELLDGDFVKAVDPILRKVGWQAAGKATLVEPSQST